MKKISSTNDFCDKLMIDDLHLDVNLLHIVMFSPSTVGEYQDFIIKHIFSVTFFLSIHI